MRNGASPCPGGTPGLSEPCVIRREMLAERGDLLDRDRDEVARRPDLVQLVVVAGHDVLRLRLREDDLADTRRVLDGEVQLDAGVRLLVRRLDLGDQVDAEADDAQRPLVGRRGLVARARLCGEQRLGREGGEAPRARRHVPVAGADPSGCRSCFSVSFRKWSNPIPCEPGPPTGDPSNKRRLPRARTTRLIRDQDAFYRPRTRACQQRHTDRSAPLSEYVRRFRARVLRGPVASSLRRAIPSDGRSERRSVTKPISLGRRTPLPDGRGAA